MAVVFLDGFDKYGGITQNIALSVSLKERLTAGEWTNINAAGSIVTGLSQTGFAARGGSNYNKQFYTNYSRLIGGFRFNATSAIDGFKYSLAHFFDQLTHQCCIILAFGPVSGVLQFRNGDIDGSIIATGGFVLANTTRYLEWDITFGDAAPYSIWLDGVLILSGTADTTTTANNYASAFGLYYDAGVSSIAIDDLYLFDTTGTANNAVLLNNPRIETTFPIADDTTQFSYGTTTLGEVNSRTAGLFSMSADNLYLRYFTVPIDCTLASISFLARDNIPTVSFRPVVYANGALPETAGALLASGSAVMGTVVNTPVVMPLTTPLVIVAGTTIWLGFMVDTAVSGYQLGADDVGSFHAAVPFSSGPPSTAPALTQQGALVVYGTLTGVTDGWFVVARNPTQDDLSYQIDLTPGHEDLYHFSPLSLMAETVHSVVLKGYFKKTDVGIRTVSLRTKSGAVDSPGTFAGQAPHVEKYTWLTSNYATDPNTGAQWLKPALNAALGGFKVDT